MIIEFVNSYKDLDLNFNLAFMQLISFLYKNISIETQCILMIYFDLLKAL